MIRALIAVVLFVLAMPAQGQTVQVESGEHAGFSRLVLQLDAPAEWVFGRVSGGYELRLGVPELAIDTSRVFDRIPRRRIRAVSSPGPGRLRLAVDCPCNADAFEIRPGRIVLDIRDGAADPASPFERALPEPAPVPAQPRGRVARQATGPDAIDRLRQMAAALEPAFDARPAAPRPPVPELPVIIPGSRAADLAARRGLPVVSGLLPGEPAAATLAGPLPGDASASPTQAPVAAAAPAVTRPGGADRAVSHGDLLGVVVERPRVSDTRRELVYQLSRAALQGLIDFQRPQPPEEQDRIPDGSQAEPDRPDPPVDTGPEPLSGPSERTHVRIETAADLARPDRPAEAGMTAAGLACLPTELFDVASWGPTSDQELLFGTLRARLVGEFDRPDTETVLALVRRNIYLGFGAEARLVLEAYGTELPNADILGQLADVIDGRPVPPEGRLPAQLSCSSGAAIWALLAFSELPAGAEVDRRAVQRSLSELPPHLRALVGPRLAAMFLERGDVDTATTLRDIVRRADLPMAESPTLLDVEFARSQGEGEAAIAALDRIARTGSAEEARAVAALIDARITRGEPVEQDLALLAEALAVEHRGTATGRLLTRAAIRGYAAAGAAARTFARIEQSLADGDIDTAEAEKLRAEAFLATTALEPDSEFLLQWMRAGLTPDETSDMAMQARRRAVRRMLDLGLPDLALAQYEDIRRPPALPDRLLLAEAYLALADPESALEQLQGLAGMSARILAARAHELAGDHAKAAAIYAELGMTAERDRAFWRAGRVEALADSQDDALRTAASLAVQDRADPAASGPPTVRSGRALVELSGRTRQAIRQLLGPS